MSVFEIIDSILFKPLQLIFEVLYTMANKVIDHPGLSIIALSLMMNFLVLPLYMRADALQEEEKQTEARMRDVVNHIKKTFKGDEKMMMLQTCYRQNNYKPTDVLKSAVSLFLEIPFFIAAYRFLSGLQLLNGVSFGPIADLSKPDALITIAGFSINLLPVIMTAVNLVSCVIFTKGGSLKSKIQLYAMAIFFLFFLYTSPSGLVFYWTLNNIFSLVKTIFYKLKNPKLVLTIMASAAGVASIVYGEFFYPVPTLKKTVLFVGLGILLQIPAVIAILGHFIKKKEKEEHTPKKAMFYAGGAFLAVLTGLVIPSSVIKSSPQEFVDITYYRNPVWYLVSSLCLAVGIFVVWCGVFYSLANNNSKKYFEKGIWVICGAAVVDYMFFAKNLGILSSILTYEDGFNLSKKEQLVNIAVLIGVAALLYFISSVKKIEKHISTVLIICVIAFIGMSAFNIVNINSSVADVKEAALEGESETPNFTLTKNGKNVIVIMLDRALGELPEYFFNEKPELAKQFDGFTYYKNTVSFGGFTNFGTPGLFGGYEYTPTEMNTRSDESIPEKHNEAIKVLPVLFSENGYKVTLCDPVYANYSWTPDLSAFDEYPEINTYLTTGKFTDPAAKESIITKNMRNFFCYGIFKISPLCLQEVMYDLGNYNSSNTGSSVEEATVLCEGQTATSEYTSTGCNQTFMNSYNVLQNLPNMTNIDTESSENTYLSMVNDTTHEPMLLQEPEYVPSGVVDNTEYESTHSDRYTVNGQTLNMTTNIQYIHYQTNMAAYIQLGNYFDYLRENGVYDNTRIIVCSDHGRDVGYLDSLETSDGLDTEMYYPLLLVKDFDSTGEVIVNNDFMTNADVPTLLVDGLIDNPVNPFTGKLITNTEKKAHAQIITASTLFDIATNNGNTYLPGSWYSVHTDSNNMSNWTKIADDAVLTTDAYNK